MKPLHVCLPRLAVILAAAPLGAQLRPGTFVATTGNPGPPINPVASTVQAIDPFAVLALPLAIAGFPGSPSTEVPDSVWIESSTSMLLGSRISGGSGNLYRATFTGSWSAAVLNTAPLQVESAAGIVAAGGNIYVVGSPAGTTAANVVRVPLAGGAPVLFSDLAGQGARGAGTAITMLGADLHVFTYDATIVGPSAEHWRVGVPAGNATFVGALPKSRYTTNNLNFGPVQADADPVTGNLYVAGVYGDVLVRTATGVNVLQLFYQDTLDALALNRNTKAIGIGDRNSRYDEFLCDGSVHREGWLTLPPPIPAGTRLTNLAYFPASSEYLPDGAGCNQSFGGISCNYVETLPASGPYPFAITMERGAQASYAVLILGVSNSAYGSIPLPLDLGPLGAPGCFVRASLDVLFVSAIGTGGMARVLLPIPPSLHGVVFTQWLNLDHAANPLGIAASGSRRLVIP